MSNQVSKHKLRPAGRHVLSIGRDLIKDNYSAVMELVKNAYDADSPSVNIIFSLSPDEEEITIIVEDIGHGMTRDVVVEKWLIPSTDDKLIRKVSPEGRTMQGKKGIGRYAAAILGNKMLLETTTPSGETTELSLNWEDFENAKYMDDVEITISSSTTVKQQGTRITITGHDDFVDVWDERQLEKLEYELKKLISPAHESKEIGKFDIFLTYNNFWEEPNLNAKKKIEPYPLVEFFDYKISGKIDSTGKGELIYESQKTKNIESEIIEFNLTRDTLCGSVEIDIRAYDRESESIDSLIKRGLKNDEGDYLNKTQAKNLLNSSNGVGVYRNGFRIRPLGDPDFDWLKLNNKRIQNPSMCIGSNQVIGFVKIEDELKSSLEEKSARDGLKENRAYDDLINIVGEVINELQQRRFLYRRKAGLTRSALKIEQDFERLFSFDDIKDKVRKKLKINGIDDKEAEEIIELLSQKEEDNAKLVEDIKEKVTIYQGQATLGKIINVIMHEGRKPLGFFKNQIKNLNFWAKEFQKNPSDDLITEILNIANGVSYNSKIFTDLFSRLDPLSTARRGKIKEFYLRPAIEKSVAVYENEFIKNGVMVNIECSNDISFIGWDSDIYVILTNLLDNSLFWITEKKCPVKCIDIKVTAINNQFNLLNYKDSGPGIDTKLIDENLIFEPEFTTKQGGTGIGLAIAGEAAARNNLELKAFESDSGAYFRIQKKEK
ncbi:MAG: ATP-binding protein [Gammaproteobacteria bacterium]|nr:ATP-binding protein [Gammaproteobacteria bacterium]